MQASLPQDLVPIGATTLLFGISTSCAVFLAIGQSVIISRLGSELSSVLPANTVEAVISMGATNFRSILDNSVLPGVINAYSKATTQVWVC